MPRLINIRVPVACFLAIACLQLTGCRDKCRNKVEAQQFSTGKTWNAVTFSRNCDASSGNNLQISILPADAKLPGAPGNAFSADDNQGITNFIAQPQWISDHVLQITYSSRAHIFRKEIHVGPVEIHYVEQR